MHPGQGHQNSNYPYGQYPSGQPVPPPQPIKSVSKQRGLSAGSHTFHLILTLVTCGMWGIFVWLPLWIFRMIVRKKKVTRHYY